MKKVSKINKEKSRKAYQRYTRGNQAAKIERVGKGPALGAENAIFGS